VSRESFEPNMQIHRHQGCIWKFWVLAVCKGSGLCPVSPADHAGTLPQRCSSQPSVGHSVACNYWVTDVL